MSLDHDDYATLARIEDHLRRIADALERPRTDRLTELVDIAQRGLDRVAYSFRPAGSPDDSRLAMQDLAMELRDALDAKPCDDRTCTDRDHWAPRGPNQCDPGCTRPSLHDGDCIGPCAATMPGHRCARAEHSDDRHQWTMTDEEYDRRREEAGVPREVFDDVRAWADGREAAQRRLTAGCSDCGGECGQLDGPGAAVGSDRRVADRCGETFNDSSAAEERVWVCTETVGHVGYHYDAARLVGWGKKLPSMTPDYAAAILSRQTEPDPLDEDDHRPRHDRDGDHWRKGPRGWYLSHPENGIFALAEIANSYGPLTFCDCPDPTDPDRATD